MTSIHDESPPNTKRICGLFVTGTDTGVGKTFVTGAIVNALRAENFNTGVWKPVQSGAWIGSGATDAECLLRMTGIEEQPEAVAPYTFGAPLTPFLAAKHAGVNLTLEGLIAAGEPLLQRYEAMFIEGAAGLAVPLTEHDMVIDLIARLGVPALIVARSGLGTINHTLLTALMLQQRNVPIIGVVMNDADQTETMDDPSVETNAYLIERFGGLTILGRLPRFQGVPDRDSLTQMVRSYIDLKLIKAALSAQKKGI